MIFIEIAGLQKLTLIDYPGKVACTIFSPRCNFKCLYCHNPELVFNNTELISEEEIFKFLKDRRGFLEGVVLTGGEPTLQSDLVNFVTKIKDMGYKVKLDTNGTLPDVVELLIKKKLVDFIAMDIKAPLDKYEEITCVKIDKKSIVDSIKTITNSRVDYVFRTTAWPKLTLEDYGEIGKLIEGAKLFHLQQFSNKITLDPFAKEIMPVKRRFLEEISHVLKQYTLKVEVLNI